MFHEFGIPVDWLSQSQNYFTYHGDVYPGNIVFCPNYKGGFFIVPNINIHRLRNLKPEDRTPENYKLLGWEIKDKDIIRHSPIPSSEKIGSIDNYKSLPKNGHDVWKRLFVFGAGASAFCSFGRTKKDFEKSSLRPPTGFEIFDERFDSIIDNYPGAKLTIPLFESKGFDIEACLQEEWEIIRTSFNPQVTSRHINVQFFLSDLFKRISFEVLLNHRRGNLYSLFALKLQTHLAKNTKKNFREKVGLVSFNYDTILDGFIEQNFPNLRFQTMIDYVDWETNPIALFKPHGSWNWGWSFVDKKIPHINQVEISKFLYGTNTLPVGIYYDLLGGITENIHANAWGIEQGIHTSGLGKFTINKNRIKHFDENGCNYFPSILMPYRDKDEFTMPYYHNHAMEFFMGAIEEVYLIGWKGNEEAFNKCLNDHAHNLKRIVIVNPDSIMVKKHISKRLDLNKYEIEVVESFEDFVCNKMDAYLG